MKRKHIIQFAMYVLSVPPVNKPALSPRGAVQLPCLSFSVNYLQVLKAQHCNTSAHVAHDRFHSVARGAGDPVHDVLRAVTAREVHAAPQGA